MENKLKHEERIRIKDNWDISLIEKHIQESLYHCKMWGDLNISQEEYTHIKATIVESLGSLSSSGLKALFSRYPVVMVTDMIFFVLYEYDNIEFWSGWAGRFNINIRVSSQTEIGRIVRGIFERYNFGVIEDGGYAYVTPILCQAGIPITCFDKLFDILDSTIGSTYFSPREIVSELMGYRSYLIDSPVERFFRLHTERAIELITLLREMMQPLNISADDIDVSAAYGVQPRIVKRYVQWRDEAKKLGRKSMGKTQYYFSPKLVYDTIKGVCILIPEQTLRQDSIYKLRWTIIHEGEDGNCKTYFSQVYNVNGRNFTREASIPIGAAIRYTIEVKDADNDNAFLTNPWRLDGIDSASDILVFNDNGSLLTTTQRKISQKGTYMVFDSRLVRITELKNINKVEIELPAGWPGFDAFCVYPSEKDAMLTLSTSLGVISLECKHSFDIELMQSGTLFDEKYTGTEIPVYTRFPTIAVNGILDNYNQDFFNYWQVIIVHRASNTKHTIDISEIGVNYESDLVRIYLEEYVQKFYSGKYGKYELRVYDGNTRKYFMFYLSPKIEYLSHIEEMESDRSIDHRRAVFYVKKNDATQLEFESGSGINDLPATIGADWVEISTINKPSYINGYLMVGQEDCIYKIPFKKTIRKLHWSFWDENQHDIQDIGKTKQFYLEDLIESKWRLTIHFTGEEDQYDNVQLVLETVNSMQIQSKDIVIDHKGNFTVSLNLFIDTIKTRILPQRLMLYITKGYDDYLPICIAIIKSYVELKNPKYIIHREGPIVYWTKSDKIELINKRIEITSLNNQNAEPINCQLKKIKTFRNKAGNRYEGIILDKPLDNGIYYIDATEDIEFSFFDDEQQRIPVYDSEHVICVNGKQILEQLFANKSSNVSEWLSAATVALFKDNWINALFERLQVQVEHSKMIFDSRACSSLLFSLLINCGKKSNISTEIKSKAKEVCTLINDFIITNSDRIEILKLLLESNISDVDYESIINDLQLYLFSPNGAIIFEKSSVQRMWHINEKIAILMNLRNCVSNVSVDIDRVVSKVGSESLREIINITPGQECRSRDWHDCFEFILSGKCQCHFVNFECSKKVWGDASEYAKLFVADNRGNFNRVIPDENHTDGYEILGSNYLTLIYKLIPEKPDSELKECLELMKNEIYKCDNLSLKYVPYFTTIHSAIINRLGDNPNIEKLFYQIGCASILIALSGRNIVNVADLQELLPFFKHAIRVYSDLVYRDLIVSELYFHFGRRKGN